MPACVKRLYDENGYVSIPWILSRGFAFNMIIGGRGTGKTYGAIKWMLEQGKFFMYLRRTQTQADMVSNNFLSPFKSVCEDMNIGFKVDSVDGAKNVKVVYLDDREYPVCLTAALSTISNIRGLGASDIEYLVFDEFISEPHERPIKNEASAFFNGYETINRNRELQGKPPMQTLFLSNSENIISPLLMELELVGTIVDMKKKGQVLRDIKERNLSVYLLDDSPISAKKKDTVIYQFAGGTRFSEMALENTFANGDFPMVQPQNIKPYRCIIKVGELYIYEHRSDRKLYVSRFKTGTPIRSYTADDTNLKRFRLENRWLWNEFVLGRVFFESEICQLLLTKYLQ